MQDQKLVWGMENFKAVDYMVVLYQDDGEKYIQFPTAFASKWGNVLRNPLIIKIGDNIERNVQFDTSNTGEIWFAKGWSSIADDLKLGRHDILLFTYNGNSSFDMKCFDAGSHGKTLPPKPVGEFPLNIMTMFNLEQYKEKLMMPLWFGMNYRRLMTNPITIFLDDGSNWQVSWIDVEGNICLEKGWKEVVSHYAFKYEDLLFMVFRSISEMELRVVRKEDKRWVIAQDHTSGVFEEELWKTEITDSKREPGQPLYIPVDVVKSYFADKPSNIKVRLPNGEIKIWSFIWTMSSGTKKKRQNQGFFGKGWYDFVSESDLPKGQNIRFVKRFGEDNIRVEIITN